jgi:hypothetical protein
LPRRHGVRTNQDQCAILIGRRLCLGPSLGNKLNSVGQSNRRRKYTKHGKGHTGFAGVYQQKNTEMRQSTGAMLVGQYPRLRLELYTRMVSLQPMATEARLCIVVPLVPTHVPVEIWWCGRHGCNSVLASCLGLAEILCGEFCRWYDHGLQTSEERLYCLM